MFWITQFVDASFPAELADYTHVVHCPAIPALFYGTAQSPLKPLIDQSIAFLFFGVFLFFLGQRQFLTGEDETDLLHRATNLYRLPLEPEGSLFRDVLVGFFEDTSTEVFKIFSERFRTIKHPV